MSSFSLCQERPALRDAGDSVRGGQGLEPSGFKRPLRGADAGAGHLQAPGGSRFHARSLEICALGQESVSKEEIKEP